MERPRQYADSWVMVPMYDDPVFGESRGRIWPFETEEHARAAADVADQTQGFITVTRAYVFPPVGNKTEPYVVDFK